MQRTLLCLLATASTLGLSACSDDDKEDETEILNQPPAFLSGELQRTSYDGSNNDLLTAGLGATGLAGAAPSFADPLNPTATELRTLAIYNNYRALVDTSANGGYGTLFGPQVDAQDNEGRVAGDEYLAFMTVGDNDTVPVTTMVQIPASFDPANACMVTAPSSGSRGVYGAIGTAGEWGLKKGCAVVYTDKGTGTGADNVATGTAQRIDGTLTQDTSVPVQFRTDLSAAERSAFNTANPDRFAFKHAHSRVNPEADWGQHVLQSIQVGFYVLNEQFGEETPEGGRRITLMPDNTLVIASSVSNGGGASLRAAEQDSEGLIDGIAVSEPNVNPTVDSSLSIRQGNQPAITGHSRSLLDYTTAIAIYQGCANRAANVRDDAPFNEVLNNVSVNENTCAALAAKGLVTGADLDAQAADAQRILEQDYGIQPEQNLVAPSHFGANVAQSVATTYANAYGRFGVEERLCGLSFAATNASDGSVMPLSAAQEASLFSVSNGIPPTGGVNLVFDDATGMPTNLAVSTSASSGLRDYGLDALLCLRSLAQNSDAVSGAALSADAAANAARIADGIQEVRATGDLQGKPAIVVTGRADAILPINHTSRPYFGLNQKIEGSDSGLHYYEVLNAHHLDAFNAFPGFDARYVPLHRYYIQALDLMYDHLSKGSPLPPSQVVRTTPRGTGAPALTAANVPPIAATPDAADLITFETSQVRIPD